jgi:hypothetical protein
MTSDIILTVSAVVSAFGILIGSTYAIYRIARRIGDTLGVDKEGRSLSERLERVEYQLWENGGTSLADRVNNIELHVIKVSTEIELIKDITLGLHNSASASSNIPAPQKKTRRKVS